MGGKSRSPGVHVKRGDTVMAICGEDAIANKTGKVLRVFPRRQRAVVEGFNVVKKTVRKSQDNPQGGILEKEASVHVSNLRVVDKAESKGTGKRAPKARGSRARKRQTDEGQQE